MHLGEKTDALLPTAAEARSEATQWLFAGLNSIEPAVIPWAIYTFFNDNEQTPGRKVLDEFLVARLKHLNAVLADREWLAGRFSIADILVSDILRLLNRYDRLVESPACKAYLERAVSRPAFAKAHADQLAHFAAAD